MVDLPDGHQHQHPDGAPADQHDQHGHHGLAQAPEHGGGHVGKAQQAEEQGANPAPEHPVGDDVGVLVEGGHQLGREEEDDEPDDLHGRHGAEQAEADALLHPIQLLGADVLGDEGGHGHGEGRDRQEGEALHLSIGADARHGGGGEGVDIGLNEHVGKVDHRVLHRRGQAEQHDLSEPPPVEPDLAKGDADVPGLAQQADHDQQRGDPLGHDGGDGRPVHAHVKDADQGDVQDHVDGGAGDEVIEGMGGVAAGLQDAHEDVVHDQARAAGEIDFQIQGRVGEHVLRRTHGPQDHRREQHPQRRKEHAEEQPHGHGRVDGLGGLLRILRADISGDHDARAHGEAGEGAHGQIDDGARAGHGGQGVAPHQVAHDQGVGGVIELLKQIPDEHRDRVAQDPLVDGPLRHQILFGFVGSLHVAAFSGWIC